MKEEGSSSSESSEIPHVDDLYFSVLCHDQEEMLQISDEKYAQELHLQEALLSSAISHRMEIRTTPETENQSTKKQKLKKKLPERRRERTIEKENQSTKKQRLPERRRERTIEKENQSTKKQKRTQRRETGESSSQLYFCSICMDAKHAGEMFRNNNSCCSHSFCADCIGKHIAAKIQQNITMVKCPDLNCQGVIEPEFCRSLVPGEVFDRWENALCESMILVAQKFYCPFKDCSAMLVDDGGEVVTVSECPNCRRLFCAQCKVSWHAGMECREFQSSKKDEREGEREDIMLMELAKKKKWTRCPSCKFYVQKVNGCNHITCRCTYEFCYRCGSKWSEIHTCRRS